MTEPQTPPARPTAPPSVQRARRERIAGGTATALGVAFALAIAVGVNYVAARNYRRFDWTKGGMYTLSPRTKRVLRKLGADVRVVAFASEVDPRNQALKELLLQYRSVSRRVQTEWVDPEANRDRFRMLQERYGIRAGRTIDGRVITDTALVVESGGRNWIVTPDDMTDFSPHDAEGPGEGGAIVSWKAEAVLTGAVLQVTEARRRRLCFTKGHGELGIDESSEAGLSHFKDELRHENYEVEEIETRGRAQIASDCDVVVVAGPEHPFAEEEANLLKSYLDRGGNALLLLEPAGRRGEILDTGFEAMLRWAGIEVQKNFVVEADTAHLLPQQAPITFAVTDFGAHPITDPFRRAPLAIFSTARSVRRIEGSAFSPTELFKTTGQAWAETDLAGLSRGDEPTRGPGDVGGPVSLGVALETAEAREGGRRRGGRLVVIGSIRFLSRQLYDLDEVRNRDIALGTVAWLAEREALIDIAPKRRRESRIQLTEDQFLWSAIYVVVFLPLAAAIGGVAVWWRRRS